jgi:hypothetical protein
MKDIIRQDAKEAAIARNLLFKAAPSLQETNHYHCGLSLNPSPIPLHLYNQAIEMQHVMGLLYANLCRNPDLIIEIAMSCPDEFIEKLVKITQKALKSEHYQPLHLCKHRSDFMMDR